MEHTVSVRLVVSSAIDSSVIRSVDFVYLNAFDGWKNLIRGDVPQNLLKFKQWKARPN